MHQLDRKVREAVLDVLWSATAADGGPTQEQASLIELVGAHVLGIADRSPVDVSPTEAAAVITDDRVRRLVAEGLVTLELMRHPGSDDLVARVDGYLAAFGFEGPEQLLVRDAVAEAQERVEADWNRTRTASVSAPAPEADLGALAARVDRMAACAPGTLGRAFHDFNERHGFTYPEAHLSLIGHDFAHVLTGYEPVPEGELALQALLVSAAHGGAHASGLLASLLLFEVGLLPVNDIEPRVAVLDRPGAAVLFADAVARGAGIEVDLQALDHFALADRDLEDLRRELAVPAAEPGPFTFAG